MSQSLWPQHNLVSMTSVGVFLLEGDSNCLATWCCKWIGMGEPNTADGKGEQLVFIRCCSL